MEPRDLTPEITAIGRKYHFAEQPPVMRWVMEHVSKGLRWISDRLRELFNQEPSRVDSQGMSDFLQFVVWIIGIIGVIVLLLAIFRRVARHQEESEAKSRGASAVEELQDAAGWRRYAESLAGRQDFKGACRALYLSLLQAMSERGIAEFAPARTNYEYAYALSSYPEVQKDFRRMAERVEVIWFGNREAGEQDYREAIADLDRLSAQMVAIEKTRANNQAVTA